MSTTPSDLVCPIPSFEPWLLWLRLFLRIGEQESKASKHLYQLGLLAKSLNRTLVLPPMFKSRFGTCFQNSFDYYYDENAFAHLDIPSVPFETFARWVSRRYNAPRAQIFEILLPQPGDDNTALSRVVRTTGYTSLSQYSNPTSKGKRNHCLGSKAPRLRFPFHPLSVSPLSSKWYLDADETVGFSQDVLDEAGSISVDVLAVTWEIRHPLFSAETSNGAAREVALEYASRWLNLASSIAGRLSPFIAVHWRMETVDPQALPHCARALVSTIESLLEDRHRFRIDVAETQNGTTPSTRAGSMLRTVYLATDYPLEGPSRNPHSGTFQDIGEFHHAAIDILRAAFIPNDRINGNPNMRNYSSQPGVFVAGANDGGIVKEGRLHEMAILTLTSLAEEVSYLSRERVSVGTSGRAHGTRGPGVRFEDMDPGLVAILDKNVAIRADIFVSGAKGCSRHR